MSVLESVALARIAVLVDGDNIGAQHLPALKRLARQRGRVDVWRIYADAVTRKDWGRADGVRLIHAGSGKNAADLLLALDAMELVLRGAVDGVVVASSDGDFSHLALRLREYGCAVYGIGEQKAPGAFRAACTGFEVLTAPSSEAVTGLDRDIRDMIAEHSQNGEGMLVCQLGPKMHKRFGTKISKRPEKTWRGYLSKRPTLYDLDARGPEAKVRFVRAAFDG